MIFRTASPSDIPALAALATQTFCDAFAHTYEADELEQRIRETRSEAYFRDALARHTVLLAELDGRMVGYAEFGPGDDGAMVLARLYVLASHQRQGIGGRLLEAALQAPGMQARVYLDVWEHSVAARRLYERYGFRDTGRRDEDGDIIMVLDGASPEIRTVHDT